MNIINDVGVKLNSAVETLQICCNSVDYFQKSALCASALKFIAILSPASDSSDTMFSCPK